MFISKDEKLTFSPHFLQPKNANQRQYEALRAYFVEGLSSKDAANRFGYSPGSFRGIVHQFRQDPERDFFGPTPDAVHEQHQRDQLRLRIVSLRKQNLSIYDISRSLQHEGITLSAVAVNQILRDEGFARLPRRLDEERPAGAKPIEAEVADVQQLDLTPRSFRTKFGGLFLFLLDSCRADSTPSSSVLSSPARRWSRPVVPCVLCSRSSSSATRGIATS
jgi:transposase